jgi:hypothetical protein
MARRKESGLDIVKSFPWPVGIAVGSIAFPVIRYGIGWYPASAPTGIFKQVGSTFAVAIVPLAWMVLILCWIAAGVSYIDLCRHPRRPRSRGIALQGARSPGNRSQQFRQVEGFEEREAPRR